MNEYGCDSQQRQLKRNGSGYYDPTAYQAMKKMIGEKAMSEEKIYRGDIFTTLKSDQTEGNMAVIVSNDNLNEHNACVMIVYLNNKREKKYDSDVIINAKGLNVAECNRVYSLHKSRIGEYVRTCTDDEMDEINRSLMYSLSIDGYPACDPEQSEDFEQLRKRNIELNTEIEELRKSLANSEKICSAHYENVKRLTEQKDKAEEKNEETIIIKTERDMYKKLYNETLEKLIAG